MYMYMYIYIYIWFRVRAKIAQRILLHKNMLVIRSTINFLPLVFYLYHNMLKK